MIKLTNHAVASAVITIISASCVIPAALAQGDATTAAPAKPAATAPAKKPAKKWSAKKRAKVKKDATKIIQKGAQQAGAGETGGK